MVDFGLCYRSGGTDDYLRVPCIVAELGAGHGFKRTLLRPPHSRIEREQHGPVVATMRQPGRDAVQEDATETQRAQNVEKSADAAPRCPESLQKASG